jgi:hypothetical protein
VTAESPRIAGQRTHLYYGVGLNENAQKYIESREVFNEGIF